LDLAGGFRIYSSGDKDTINGTYREYNLQFDDNKIKQYDRQCWFNDQTEIGGDGEYLSWELLERAVYINDNNEKFLSYDVDSGIVGDQIYEQISSLRQGEVYRYGAIFYNNEG
jgi:hypothetical protein